MEDSILKSTKQTLGLPPEDPAFDQTILVHINAALAVLDQLGAGIPGGTYIEDDTAQWSTLQEVSPASLAMIKPFIFLKVKMLFDPPTTSFGLDAAKGQLADFEWRLANAYEEEPA